MIFDDIYKIMIESFPVAEIRDYQGQKSLLERNDYTINVHEQDGVILGFCAYYKFDDFYYIENLACTPQSRGLGIGTRLVQDVLDEAGDCMVILEVELPHGEVEKRRIHFYERLGFCLNPHYHYLPSLNSFSEGMELKIMSFSRGLTEEEQKACRRVLNQKVYQVKEEYRIDPSN